jgi:hypothetical protein
VELRDKMAIQELVSRYGHVMDAQDWSGLSMVFVSNVIFDATAMGSGRYESLDELRGLFSNPECPHPLAHHATNVIVRSDASPTSARVVTKWLGVREDGSAQTGTYDDVVTLTEEGWRISERIAKRRRRVGPGGS